MRKEIIDNLKKYKEELECISIKKVNEEAKFLSIESYDCTFNDGRVIRRDKILKNGKDGDAVLVFPITEDNQVILILEPRVFTKEKICFGIPAGYIEEDEDSTCSAKRELLEEVGYSTDELISVGEFYQDQGISSAMNYFFVALNCKKISEQKLDEDEQIKYIKVNLDELEELDKLGSFKGLNTRYAVDIGKKYMKRK